jgi:hypothetical protein
VYLKLMGSSDQDDPARQTGAGRYFTVGDVGELDRDGYSSCAIARST